MLKRMRHSITIFASCVFIMSLVLIPICGSTSLEVPVKYPQKWDFISLKGSRDSKFQDLYDSVNEKGEEKLEERVAFAIQSDIFMLIQFLMTSYIFLNHIIEPFLEMKFQSRIRFQNLSVEIFVHLLEIWTQIQIPKDLVNQIGIFTEADTVGDARKDMMKLMRKREGQQIAYSLVCILSGLPGGCLLPLIIRDLPLLLKSIGIIVLLCYPKIGKEELSSGFLHNFYRITGSSSSSCSSGRDTDSDTTSNSDNEAVDGEDIQKDVNESENQNKFDTSINNSRVLLDLVCELVSLSLEIFVLTKAVINLPKGKISIPILVKHMICAGLTIQYIGVRGTTFGELISETFKGTKALENLRNNLNSHLNDIGKVSPKYFIDLIQSTIAQYSKGEKNGKNGKKKSKNTQMIKKKKSKGKSLSTPQDDQ